MRCALSLCVIPSRMFNTGCCHSGRSNVGNRSLRHQSWVRWPSLVLRTFFLHFSGCGFPMDICCVMVSSFCLIKSPTAVAAHFGFMCNFLPFHIRQMDRHGCDGFGHVPAYNECWLQSVCVQQNSQVRVPAFWLRFHCCCRGHDIEVLRFKSRNA